MKLPTLTNSRLQFIYMFKTLTDMFKVSNIRNGTLYSNQKLGSLISTHMLQIKYPLEEKQQTKFKNTESQPKLWVNYGYVLDIHTNQSMFQMKQSINARC